VYDVSPRYRGGRQTSDENGRQRSFFEVMSEVQKDPEDVSAGIGKTKI
jgi:hypothetical protein